MVDFHPIEPNPYIVGNPIRDPKMFFGRSEDFRFIQDKLAGGRHAVVVLCGGRRSGKTSVLLQLLDGRLGPSFLPVLIDMQQMGDGRDEVDFWTRVMKLIRDEVGRNPSSDAQAKPSVGASTFDALIRTVSAVPVSIPNAVPVVRVATPAPARRDTAASEWPSSPDVFFFDELPRLLAGRELLLLVDEYEIIEEQALRPDGYGLGVIHFLSSLLDAGAPVSFVFTGSKRVEDGDARVWQRLLGKAFHKRISFLDRRDAERLIRDPVAGRVRYGEGVVDEIVRLTAGQPFYTQVVCQALVDRLNEERRNDCSTDDVRHVAGALSDNPLPQMIYWWKSLPHVSQLAVAAAAECVRTPDVYVDPEALATPLAKYRGEIAVPLDRSRLLAAAQSLVEGEVFEKDRAGGVRFRVDLLRRWIEVEHPLWDAIQEGRREQRAAPASPWRRRGLWASALIVLAAAVWIGASIKSAPPPPALPRPSPPSVPPSARPSPPAAPRPPATIAIATGASMSLGTNERSYREWRNPSHDVTLRRFRIGARPVTNGEFRKLEKDWPGPSDLAARGMPWTRAREYCRSVWCAESDGCDLPTEAQWEAAARDALRTWERERDEAPAAALCSDAEGAGLLGMLCGREWTRDTFGPLDGRPGVRRDLIHEQYGPFKVVRGHGPEVEGVPHPAFREAVLEGGRADIGFRCVRPTTVVAITDRLLMLPDYLLEPGPAPHAKPDAAKAKAAWAADVGRRIDAFSAEFSHCASMNKALAPDSMATMPIELAVGATGHVDRASVRESSVEDAATEACVLNVVRQIELPPPPGGPKTVSISVVLEGPPGP